jgi:hypothetical protein
MDKYLIKIIISFHRITSQTSLTTSLEFTCCVQANFVNNVARFGFIKFGEVGGKVFGVSIFGINKCSVRTFAPWRLRSITRRRTTILDIIVAYNTTDSFHNELTMSP